MIELTSLALTEKFIKDHPLSFIYVSRTNCGVCHALLPQIKNMLGEFPSIQLGYINADALEEIAGYFSIFTVPALLLFVDGKEMIREARFVTCRLYKKRSAKFIRWLMGKLNKKRLYIKEC